jgi:carbamate kinase
VKLVVALGGNALLRRSQAPSAANQLENVRLAAVQLARVAAGHQVVLTHGNGPQVGLLVLQSASYGEAGRYPLDVLDAETEGMLGYLLEQEIANLLPATRTVVTLLTRVEVDRHDAAFATPTKPIGLAGSGVRRLVASPRPVRVLALDAIRWLLAHGALVIAAGGGGIPVMRRLDGCGMEGVEAVIDKDLCSALIATELQADALIIATDVAGVFVDWGQPGQRILGRTTPGELAQHQFATGSMAPKVEAACAFVRATGRQAVIGPLERIEDMLAGRAGTEVTADGTRATARAAAAA